MLELKNIVKKYKRGGVEFYALENINFKIEKGDFIHIIGRSGSGKSTLLNIISALLSPDSGEIIFEGRNLLLQSEQEKALFINEKIGCIPQDASLLSYLSVLENVILPHDLHEREDSVDVLGRARYILSSLGLSQLENSYPRELSGGEARRVMIARALINEPQILIADEPTSDLDVVNTRCVMELLSKLNENGMTVLLVTHELNTLKYGKKIFTMESGKIYEGKQIGD